MKFHEKAKRNLFRFVKGVNSEYSIDGIKDCISSLKGFQDFDSYFDNIINEINDRNQCDAAAALVIVAGLYYGRELALKHLERDYKPDLPRKQLKQEVSTCVSHILFGRDASGVEQVGDLQIEKEGLVPIIERIMASGKTEQEQKSELMSCLRVYGILSERSMQEAGAAAARDQDVILATNTYKNKGANSLSFAERFGGGGKLNNGKGVTFSVN